MIKCEKPSTLPDDTTIGWIYKTECVRAVPAARPTFWGPGIAHLSRTGKTCRASRSIHISIRPVTHARAQAQVRYTYLQGIYRLPQSWLRLKFSRFQNVKKVRPINAFLYVDKPPPIFSKISVRRLACAKLQINRDIITRILKNNTPALQTPS